jgi:hypothetical protein
MSVSTPLNNLSAKPALSEAEVDKLVELRAQLFIEQMQRMEEEKAEKALRDAMELKAAAAKSLMAAAAAAAATAATSGTTSGGGATSTATVTTNGGGVSSGGGGGNDKDDDESREAGRFLTRPVTAEQLPTLLEIVHEKRLDSRDRIVAEFIKIHPLVSVCVVCVCV